MFQILKNQCEGILVFFINHSKHSGLYMQRWEWRKMGKVGRHLNIEPRSHIDRYFEMLFFLDTHALRFNIILTIFFLLCHFCKQESVLLGFFLISVGHWIISGMIYCCQSCKFNINGRRSCGCRVTCLLEVNIKKLS